MNSKKSSKNTLTRRIESEETKQTQLLKAIMEYTKLSADGMPSVVPDEPKLRIRRDRPYTFSRSVNLGVLQTSSSVAGTAAYTFSLSGLPDSSDISNLFDQYRILQVTVSINPLTAGSVSALYTAIDYDDSTLPTNLQSVLVYDTLQVSNSSSVTQRTFTPRVLSENYVSAVSSGYGTIARPWLDSASNGVVHYGLKVFIPITTGPTLSYQVVADVVLQGRNPS